LSYEVLSLKKIGIVAKLDKQEALDVAKELVAWLEERQVEVFVDSVLAGKIGYSKGVDRKKIPSLVEMLVVLGGDGTLLSAARIVGTKEIPILGVNLGSLGFLTEITLDELYEVLEKILQGTYETNERMMLSVTVTRWGEEIGQYSGLNEAVINKSTWAKIIDLETWIDDEYLNTYRADGLIIATPTGSTAYSLSAGGPIIYPSIHSIVISPICSYTMSNRPIVVPDEVTVKVALTTPGSDAQLTLDGQVGCPLKVGDVVEIKTAESHIYLIKSPTKSYYEVLKSKLKWGT
jgi:NAD+ kinase